MFDRISVLGNDGAKPTITYKGKLRAVSFRTQTVLAAVEMSYRQSLQRQFLKMARRTKNAKERAEIIREGAKCLTDPDAITLQDLLTYMGSPASLPAWIRAQVEGMERANREEIKDYHQLRHSRATEVQRVYESDAMAAKAIGDSEAVAREVYIDPDASIKRRIARETG